MLLVDDRNILPDAWMQRVLVPTLRGLLRHPCPYSCCSAFELGKGPVPTYPAAGLQVVTLEHGDVIDVILQNNPENAFNGDYTLAGLNRTAQDHHPFHLHGHHFWVLGHGLGVFNESNASQVGSLNTANPVFRDTAVLPEDGWVVLRFIANNPGVWPLHCHMLWHHYLGQQVRYGGWGGGH